MGEHADVLRVGQYGSAMYAEITGTAIVGSADRLDPSRKATQDNSTPELYRRALGPSRATVAGTPGDSGWIPVPA
jgi:hypothetical protein